MILFAKKLANTESQQPPAAETEDNRFEQIRKAADRRRKADTDGTRRRARQTAEDNRLL